jgi:hypothetical protein
VSKRGLTEVHLSTAEFPELLIRLGYDFRDQLLLSDMESASKGLYRLDEQSQKALGYVIEAVDDARIILQDGLEIGPDWGIHWDAREECYHTDDTFQFCMCPLACLLWAEDPKPLFSGEEVDFVGTAAKHLDVSPSWVGGFTNAIDNTGFGKSCEDALKFAKSKVDWRLGWLAGEVMRRHLGWPDSRPGLPPG